MSNHENTPSSEAVAMVRALMISDHQRCGTQEKLEALTGLDQSGWSRYLSGQSKPSRLAREAIRRKLKIPYDSWDKPAHSAMNVHSESTGSAQAPDAAPTAPEAA